MDQNRRNIVSRFSCKGLDDHIASFQLVRRRRSRRGHAPGAGNFAVEVVAVGSAVGRNAPACPGPEEVAQREWVWTTLPILGKALYSATWVTVSEDGFHLPSTFSPVARLTTTMSLGSHIVIFHAAGLNDHQALLPVHAGTLPQVKVTRPYFGSSFAAHTCFFSSSSIGNTLFQLPCQIHQEQLFSSASTVVSFEMWTYSISSIFAQSFICWAVTS